MKKFFAEFKEFINKGNVVDMAVGVVIGAAFKAIVDSVVNDIISPLIGIIFKMDFNSLVAVVNGSEIRYGAFIMAIINFIIIAFVLFLFVKTVNKLRERKAKEEEEAAPDTKTCPFCKMEVPVEATRCGHCTSELPEEAAEE